VNSCNCSSGVVVPPPKFILQYPSGVYSETNRVSVSIYFPTLIPGWSAGLVGSSTNILDSANASTSYHLLVELINSSYVGGD